ncbi:MAG TPA: carboxypeptidase-like regulatory domain-containing protein, partial [Pyrinomonadaceae bacterium]|nr:carboxypeptidase-like regulatory domain-containing protein [Pyrinomonadaceae bacterium]
MKNSMRLVGFALAVTLFGLNAFAQSQSTTGLIQGTVVDPNGAIVAGASINVKNVNTGVERTVSSNSDGFFTAPLLPLGTYRVTISASGFTNSILENVEVTIGNTLALTI